MPLKYLGRKSVGIPCQQIMDRHFAGEKKAAEPVPNERNQARMILHYSTVGNSMARPEIHWCCWYLLSLTSVIIIHQYDSFIETRIFIAARSCVIMQTSTQTMMQCDGLQNL